MVGFLRRVSQNGQAAAALQLLYLNSITLMIRSSPWARPAADSGESAAAEEAASSGEGVGVVAADGSLHCSCFHGSGAEQLAGKGSRIRDVFQQQAEADLIAARPHVHTREVDGIDDVAVFQIGRASA